MNLTELLAAAAAWRTLDPQHAEAVDGLVARADETELREHFDGLLDFGTGGMRGPMGPGPLCMNRPIIRRVTAALGRVVAATTPDAHERGVVVGFDARHNSRAFAEEATRVLASQGFRVWLAEHTTPTPVVSFAVIHLGAVAGVMVTASHNPREDNGYKVFDHRGAQIVAPVDDEVRDAMASEVGEEPVRVPDGRVAAWPEVLSVAYHEAVQAQRVHGAHPLRIVYTPVHGVGGTWAMEALARAGYTDFHAVNEQFAPDGDFPTVAFPNPEEAGVLDRALALGTAVGADLVLANDPDADRLAAAVPNGDGTWRVLTGNETGVLLAEDLLAHGDTTPDDLVITTIVSTGLLSRIAAHHGVHYAETLTGFKWIANAALAAEGQGIRFRFGFEESIGYTAGSAVRDKDGVAAAVLMADLAAHAKAKGGTVLGELTKLWARHGRHLGQQVSLRAQGLEGLASIRAGMARLRASPPRSLGGRGVRAVVDLNEGTRRDADGQVSSVDLPRSDVLAYHLDDARVLVRPSGTEPKIKLYVEVVLPPQADPTEGDPRGEAEALIADLRAHLGL